MRVVCIYRDNADYSRMVFEWLENFYRQTGRKLEVMNPDNEAGFCEAYDIVAYPTIIAIRDNSSVAMKWSGTTLPLINEVSFYLLNS